MTGRPPHLAFSRKGEGFSARKSAPLPIFFTATLAFLAVILPVARAATHDLGPWRVETKDDTGAYALSSAGATLFEYATSSDHHVAERLPAGKLETTLASGVLTLTSTAGPVLHKMIFEPSGNRLALIHQFSCREASRVQLVVDDLVRSVVATLRIPAASFMGKPFSFTTIQVKEVAPFTATGPLGEKGELVDPSGSPGKGAFPISAFAMESGKARFSIQLSRKAKNGYLSKDKEEVPRPAGTWILRSQLKSNAPSLVLDFGDALDALTVDAWRLDIEMTPKSATP
jgi:hypothetical protein